MRIHKEDIFVLLAIIVLKVLAHLLHALKLPTMIKVVGHLKKIANHVCLEVLTILWDKQDASLVDPMLILVLAHLLVSVMGIIELI